MASRWLRFTCPKCRHISEAPDNGQLQEPCKVCGEIVEAVPFTLGKT